MSGIGSIGKIALAIALSFTAILSEAREKSGRWDAESIVRRVVKFEEEMKAQHLKRAARIKTQTGVVVPLDYKFMVNPTPEHEKIRDKFLRGSYSTSDTEKYGDKLLADLARVGDALLAAEVKASEAWIKDPKVFGDEQPQLVGVDEKTAELYGEEVTATNLGVILDNSYSMNPYLERLRAEIGKGFPNAHFMEVNGSFLRVNSYPRMDNQWFYVNPTTSDNPFNPAFWPSPSPVANAHYVTRNAELDTLSAIRALCQVRNVDAIYWFCDFDDSVEDSAIVEVAKILKSSGAKLYIQTLKRRPPRDLTEIVEDSGGAVIRHRF